MKYRLVVALVLGPLVYSVSAQDAPAALDLSQQKQKASYALGMDLAASFKWDEMEVDLKALAAGLDDMQGGKPALASQERAAVLKAMQDDIAAKAEAKKKAAGERNLRLGREFLAANAKREGVRTLRAVASDGTEAELQYEVLKSGGAGPSPGKENRLRIHYIGKLLDGRVFDSSVERGEPFAGRAGDYIAGWTEPLQRMKAGDKWRLFIPPSLGYGEFVPYNIGPYSTLIYDIELLEIGPPENASPER